MLMAATNSSSLASAPPNMKLLELAAMKAHGAPKDLRPTNPSESADSGVSDSTPAPVATTAAGRKYERRTKRFIWPDELHRLFVAAVFDVGLKNASPKALLTLMGNPACSSGLTTEHLKSHLQKYRLNYDRSRVEFLKYYDESVSEATKQHKRKGKPVQQGAVSSLFPICPTSKKRKTTDETIEDPSSDDEDDEKVAKVVATTQNITRQLDVQAKTLHMQAQFQEEIQQQLYEQALLQRQLQERLSQVTMAKGITESALNAARSAAALSSVPPTSSGPGLASGHSNKQPPPVVSNGHRAQTNQFQHHLTALSQLGPSAVNDPSNGGGSSDANGSMQWNLGLLQPTSAPYPVSPNARMSLEQQNASHLQMQMAMQQQMYLHRQMLLRKVEVSQQQPSQQQQQPSQQQQMMPPHQDNNATNNSSHLHHHHNNNNNAASTSSWNANASAAPASRPTIIDHAPAEWHQDDPAASAHKVVPSPSMHLGEESKPATPSADVMDLYGWDKLNLDVDMNDDLFSFLK